MTRRGALTAVLVAVALAALAGWLRPLAGLRTAAALRAWTGGATARHARAGEGRLAWVEAGEGPVVILLHGLRGEASVWARVMGPLADRGFRVIAPDLPGYARSFPPGSSRGLDTQVQAMERLLDHVSPGQPVRLVGNSLGGWIALRVALARPERVSRLVLSAPAGLRFEPPPIHLLVAGRPADMARNLDLAFHRAPWIPGPVLEGLTRRDPRVPLDLLGDVRTGRHRVDDLLPALDLPVLLVWGEGDGVIPPEVAPRFAEALRRCETATLPGAGHLPFLETPRAFVRAIEGFLLETDDETVSIRDRRSGRQSESFPSPPKASSQS